MKPAPAITLDVLPAGYGDCLLVECAIAGGVWRLLVDMGPDEAWPVVRERLSRIPASRSGQRRIDLAIVSHIDHDHIGAARLLFQAAADLRLEFGDVWFNSGARKDLRSVREGQELADLLGEPARALPWNRAFGAAAAVAPEAPGFIEVELGAEAPRLTLLSPTPRELTKLAKTWQKELERFAAREHEADETAPATRAAGVPDLDALAAATTPLDKAVANGSSIALLLEHRGASLLLAADAFAPVLAKALRALATERGIDGPLHVDAFKLSHHGSRGNTTRELLARVNARDYIVSTNNAVFGLPDDETIARVVKHGGPRPCIWFNYATAENERWLDPALQRRHRFEAVLPSRGRAGLTLAYPGR